MRAKAEQDKRSSYGRLYAAVLLADELSEHLGGRLSRTIRVEAEDEPEWDDVLQTSDRGEDDRRHQVKRQTTDLPKDTVGKLLEAMKDDARYHFVVPENVSVGTIGELRTLRGLCERVQQRGSSIPRIVAGLRAEEEAWTDFVAETLDRDREGALERLRLFSVNFVGLEEDLHRRGVQSLTPWFRGKAEQAWDKVVQYVADKDGVVDMTPALVLEVLPRAADPISPENELYLHLVSTVESALMLDSWPGLTDHLVRSLVPDDFLEGIDSLQAEHLRTAYPGTCPDFEQAVEELVKRASDYLAFFIARAEQGEGGYHREDKQWKLIWPNPNYDKECAASNVWYNGCFKRLWNMTFALNRFAEATRNQVIPGYRLKHGVFNIEDSLGVTNGLVAVTYMPDKYVDTSG